MLPCARCSLWVHLAALKRWLLLFLVLGAAVQISSAQDPCNILGAVRLVGGLNATGGRVQLCLNSVWGGVCSDQWDSSDASVVCRQLGYATHGALALHMNTNLTNQTTHIGSVRCYGNEHRLVDCPYLYTDTCSAFAGMMCSGNCDEGAVRLVGGGTPAHGRVEVCKGQVWGTVCDDDWGMNDARVVCRQLSYLAPGAMAVNNVLFGAGSGPIHYDEVRCTGFENSLTECEYDVEHDCSHEEDAAVVCQEPCAPYGKVRLVAGSTKTEGRVEVCQNGVWGTVCDDSWSNADASVVCRQLGYIAEGAIAHLHAHFQNGYGPIQIDEVQCLGNESSLLSCQHNTSHDCVHSEDAGVTCQGICIDGEVRLVGTPSEKQGRVEVCANGMWGTVCDRLWGTKDAKVVCKQLGFPYQAAAAYSNAYFGQGTGPVWLNRVQCLGNENSLTNCTHVKMNNCGHHDDAGVSCIAPESCSSEGQLRLTGGEAPTEGIVEICLNNIWGTVCNDRWTEVNGHVVCRQLGHTTIDATTFLYANWVFGQGSGPVQLSAVECNGNESSLLNCSHTTTHSCGHTKDIGVRCHEPCSSEGSLRLVGGANSTEGRLEYCRGVWGTVCDSMWDHTDATVVCRQLGYASNGAVARSNAYYGRGPGPILIGRAQCGGSESSLQQCPHNTIVHCTHNNDAGVTCPGYCVDGDVRLLGDAVHTHGQVEVCYGHVWSPVCVKNWTATEAQVVCRQLGLLSIGAVAYSVAQNSNFNGAIYRLQCTDSDTSLAQCKQTTSGDCSQDELAAVRCAELCYTEGELRLIRGANQTDGFLEACHDGIWMAVCDDDWDEYDAEVACRQLGFVSEEAVAYSSALLDQSAGSLHINNLGCTGNETRLQHCSNMPTSMCSGEAAVTCSGLCYENDVRLVGGSSTTEGIVEVCLAGKWGTVCANSWGPVDATVVCRQLGFLTINAIAHSFASLSGGTGGPRLSNVQCMGDESELVDCSHQIAHDCSHTEDAGVTCEEACTSGHGFGAVRLVGDVGGVGGRVEVCSGGVWGTVCDDYWDHSDAQVVCRQLGLPSHGAVALFNAHFGQGTGPIQFDNVECQGNETGVANCSYSTVGNCQHSEDAGVRCPVPPSRPRACNAVSVNSTSIKIAWLPPFVPNGPIVNYTVQYRPRFSLVGHNYSFILPLTATTSGTSQHLTLGKLLKATYYSFTVSAANIFGTSVASTGLCASYTKENVPSGSPMQLRASLKMGSLVITWLPPVLDLRNGRITDYKLVYSTTRNSSHESSFIIKAPLLNYTISSIEQDALYHIRVAAGTSVGFGSYANTTIFIGKGNVTVPIIVSRDNQQVTLGISRFTTHEQISHYQIAVVALPSDRLPTQDPDELFPLLGSFSMTAEAQSNTSGPAAYIAAEFSNSLFPSNEQYVIGDTSQPNDRPLLYSNPPLDPNKIYYTFFIRAYFANGTSRQYTRFISSNYSNITHLGSLMLTLTVSVTAGVACIVVLLVVLATSLVCITVVIIKRKKRHKDSKFYSEDDVRINPMYLDTIEADDRSHGSSWSRRADDLFVKDETLVEESDHTMNMSSSSDYDSDQQFSGL